MRIESILIIKWGALGDMVASTSAINSIRSAFPGFKICLLTNNLMRQIIPEGSIVDELIIEEGIDHRGIKGLISLIKLIFILRKKRFNIAVNLRWTSDRCAFITYLSGAKTRVSSGPKGLMNLYTIKVEHPVGRYHEIHRNTDIVKALGIPVNPENHFVFISDDDKHFADQFFKNKNISKDNTVCIHPGASKPNRAWMPERFAEVGRRIADKFNLNVIVTYGGNEIEIASSVAGDSRRIFLSPCTKTIGQLAAIIKNCSMFISNCTGPMNVAVAVHTPVIALLGSSDPVDWGPYGDIHRIIKSPLVLQHYSDEDEFRAFKEIDVEKVWATVTVRLQELGYHEN